ncbi:MAG: cytochrome P450 [Candidatus Azotimanducaceae bacterium]|jgi:cytochrome P450
MAVSQQTPHAESVALSNFNVADPVLFQNDAHWSYFERLRDEAPVHFCPESQYGPYWSISRYHDIRRVDADHKRFSSAQGITLGNISERLDRSPNAEEQKPPRQQDGGFISMDPPKHDLQRATVVGAVAPLNLAKLEDTIRERAGTILDSLPDNESFDWVDRVSIELTTQMLATLFDFPFEDRRNLTRWSDAVDSPVGEQRRTELLDCLEYFTELWNERVKLPPRPDLISMLAHGQATKNMKPFEFLGNILLLIVGGNDTTRNSISGGVLALNQSPQEFDKLRANPKLITSMVPEIIRWQTPLAHMARVANEDVELAGQNIKAGERVVMWYVSGNRDERAIPNPNTFQIDRDKPRQHLSFGFGIHRCMGNRLAEMQLRVLWEEILKRFDHIEVVGEPQRTCSNIIKGYTHLPVRLHRKK